MFSFKLLEQDILTMIIHVFTSYKVFSVSLEIRNGKSTHRLEKKYVCYVLYDKNLGKMFCWITKPYIIEKNHGKLDVKVPKYFYLCFLNYHVEKSIKVYPGVVVCTCNPATLETDSRKDVDLIPAGGNSPSIGG